MEEQIEIFKQQLTQLLQEKKDFENNNREEIFNDDQTKDEIELITEAENVLDRMIEKKKRIDKVIEIQNAFGCDTESLKMIVSAYKFTNPTFVSLFMEGLEKIFSL